MTQARRIIPVILSGGSGTRLWPVSRSERPKQLLALTDVATMLQLTARRTSDADRFAPPIVVASAAHAALIDDQLAEVGASPRALILEPMARNTAPAIALAALAADPDDMLLVMPSDHVVTDIAAFQTAIDAAAAVVEAGWLVTFGIEPDGPESGYGYVQRGDEVAPGVHRVSRFVEKPDRATAQAYLAEGGYSWNGGIFLFTARSYLDALETHAPKMAEAARTAMNQARREGARVYPEADAFARSPSDSIDYAVMEKAERVAVVPVAMGWSDVGSWDALHGLADKDADGNAHHGEIVAIDTSGCLLHSEGPLIAAVGVKDLIVVATGDAVLILPRGSSQEVKRAVERLKRDGHVTLERAS